MAVVQNKQIIFKHYIEGIPVESDMELKVGNIKLEVPEGSGAFLVKNLYLSCDPYMRGRMRDFNDSYIPPFVPGSVIEGFGVSRVVESDNPNFKPGDLISGLTGWEKYSLITRTAQLRKIQQDDIPLSYHVCQVLQLMQDFMRSAPLRKEIMFLFQLPLEQLVNLLVNLPSYMVVMWLEVLAQAKRYFPQGIDIYFDNVGGPMLDAVLLNMRPHGRIAICGMVSQQSLSQTEGIHNLFMLIAKRIRMQGFLQSDYLHLFPRFLELIISYYKQGKIVYIEDMNEGLESAPASLVGLFSGKNVGKQVICVARE